MMTSTGQNIHVERDLTEVEGFVPFRLPQPHRYPFQMDLAQVTGAAPPVAAIAAGAYTFYMLGDVGGIVDPTPQRAVAAAMCALTPDAGRYDATARPCGGTLFTYIAGDVVYYHGEPSCYQEQFYAPYRDYDRPIIAIPGNHDGDPADGEVHASLGGFIANFCGEEPALSSGQCTYGRRPPGQPNVYWTLEAPWLRIVGLYTNVPEGGAVDRAQHEWFREQIARPREGKHLVVALHQPPLSADEVHGGSPRMLRLVHDAVAEAGCRVVVSGHAHNYQRFAYEGVAYVVNGAGGYFELHDLVPPSHAAPRPIVAHVRDYSFMQVTVTPAALRLRAIAVPVPFVLATARPTIVDDYVVRLPA